MTTLVVSSTKMLTGATPSSPAPRSGVLYPLVCSPWARSSRSPGRQGHGGAGGIEHRRTRDEPIGLKSLEDLSALVGVGAVESDDDGRADVNALEGLDDALGDLLSARDTSEHIDEDRPHLLVRVDHLQGVRHDLRVGPAADVEEVRRLPPDLVDHVARAHGQSRTVGDDPDLAVEAHVLQPLLPAQGLPRIVILEGTKLA